MFENSLADETGWATVVLWGEQGERVVRALG